MGGAARACGLQFPLKHEHGDRHGVTAACSALEFAGCVPAEADMYHGRVRDWIVRCFVCMPADRRIGWAQGGGLRRFLLVCALVTQYRCVFLWEL